MFRNSNFVKNNPVKSIVTGEIIDTDEKGITVNLSENITGFIMNSNWIHLGNVQGFAKLDNFRA